MVELRSEHTDSRLAESEARYHAVIEYASDMIQSIRPDGSFEFVNKSWLDTLGYELADLDRLIVWDIVHPDELGHCQSLFGRAMQGEDIGEVLTQFITKGGDRVPVEGTVAVRFLDGRPLATHAFFRDISERLHAEELRQRNLQLESERAVRNLEKMAALGKLSAGLAHEMNNPASAARRASAELLDRMQRRDAAIRELSTQNLTSAAWDALAGIAGQQPERPVLDEADNPLLVSEREAALENWLDDHNVPEGWRLAADLVIGGFTEAGLSDLEEVFPPAALSPAVRCLAESLAVRHAADVICRSSTRMSDLVSAVKAYSHMDRAAAHAADVHDGLDNTRIIMAHQLRNVTVTIDYDRTLPPVSTYGSGLNQVWTNIIDNAADATEGKGALTIRTYRTDDRAVVEISDNGPGIPPEILSRVFEPFFTTKPQGSGTGLGLDTVWRIVTEEHHGAIEVDSRPGCTTFRVSLPLATDDVVERDRSDESRVSQGE